MNATDSGDFADDEGGESSSMQPSPNNVPAKWKPTRAEPVPVVRCTTIKKDGNRCGRWSLRGATVCIKHGGNLPVVQEHAAAVVEAARLRLIGLSDAAIDQIEDLMHNASGEAIRLKAAQDVLDRSNVRGAIEIDVQHSVEESAAERVQKRLDEIARRNTKKLAKEVEAEEDDDDIIDVEEIQNDARDSSDRSDDDSDPDREAE